MNMKNFAQEERENIENKYKWDLSELFETDEAWEKSKEALIANLDEVTKYKGRLLESPSTLLKALEYVTEVKKEATKIYIYASMNSDLDTRDMKYSGMEKELQQLFSDFSAKAAYMNPEILESDWETIDSFIQKEPKLETYRLHLTNLFRQKEHTLSEKEEKILALSAPVNSVPGSIYNTFSNAEMPNPTIILSDGKELELTNSAYSKYRASANREDRKVVFEAFWKNYKNFEASYGEILYGNVKKDVFIAKARNYASSLEASLYPKNIPTDVYHSLVDNVNKNLEAFHRYLNLKKRMLGVDTLRYYDIYAPVVQNIDLDYTYEEACQLVLESLNPLGEEYKSVVKRAIENRWLDVYPNKGKRSGAYSNGAWYDGHPFILMNYNGLYSDVSTLTHELGHTMQSYFSNKAQPYPLARYPIFTAEVASTFNEVLLTNYMIEKEENDNVKLSLYMDWLDRFKGTLFRQTQFAEFELRIHQEAEKGNALTGEVLSNLYGDILKRYYGHEQGACHIDDYTHLEWAYIPHFYYNFYVYQYSTSYTASITLAQKVMEQPKEYLDKYMEFLASGGSDYPIELLKKAGVDMTSSEVFDKAIETMNHIMDEIEKILDNKN